MDFNKVLAILQEKEDMEESIQIPVSALKSKATSSAMQDAKAKLSRKGQTLIPATDKTTGKQIPGKFDKVPVNRTVLNAINTINNTK